MLAVRDGGSTGSVVWVDPVSLVVSALAAGAAAGVTETATQVVKEAYAGLKALVLRRVEAEPGAEVAVEQYESDPETWRAPVAKVVRESGTAEDAEVVAAAQRLMELIDPRGTAAGRYVITASGDRAVAAQSIGGNVSTGDTRTS